MTLTEVSKLAKKWALFVFLAVVIYYIFLLILFPGAKLIAKALLPEKDPPNTSFGKLPALEFTLKQTKGDLNPKYTLDTQDGKLPTGFPSKIKVYPIKQIVPSFEKGKNAISTAKELGYIEEDLTTSLKEPVYKWRKAESNSYLEINTNNQSISMYTPLEGKSSFFPGATLTEEKAKSYAITILEKINRFSDPLYQVGTQNVILGQFSGNSLKVTRSTRDAQIARVDFFRTIEEYPIVGSDPQAGMIYMFLRKPASENLHLNFPIMRSSISEINQTSEATYPLISVSDAWDFIKDNKGVVVSILPENMSLLVPYTPVEVEQVFINNVYLAYYDSSSQQEYLQPVYVFEGKYITAGTSGGSIAFYYPAVSPTFIQAAN